MALTDSMFLLEIVVEEFKSLISCKEFSIKGQFADVFSVYLKDPRELKCVLSNRQGNQKRKKKSKIKNSKYSDCCTAYSAAATMQAGSSILFAINVDTLISNMKQYPLELSLWSKIVSDYKVGSTHIPWTAPYFEYFNKLHRKHRPQPICVGGEYSVFDENTSKRMAVIKLNIKLSHIRQENSHRGTSIPQEQQRTVITAFNSKPVSLLSTIEGTAITLPEETGIIKTIYGGNKNTQRNKNRLAKSIDQGTETQVSKVKMARNINNPSYNRGLATLVRSGVNINSNPTVTIIKSKSCSSINKKKTKLLNYIFSGRPAGPFGSQVYCVGYFTVQNDSPSNENSDKSVKESSETSKSSKSDEVQERYKFRICKSECLNKITTDVPVIQSSVSLDLPKAASQLITVKKCDDVNCTYEKMREVLTPPDERILLDLSSRRSDCCDVNQNEATAVHVSAEVVGAVKAMMKFGPEPCYCQCECQFNFMKKTTYCTICGGHERIGEEMSRIPRYALPFPCPIYHRILDKKSSEKSKTSEKSKISEKSKDIEKGLKGGNGKGLKGGMDRGLKGGTERSLKGGTERGSDEEGGDETKNEKKKNKDSRFKFNYGYTAPHIGHSRCALPCVGTLGAVPKHMGWLWNSEHIPGMKYRGPNWRPGATNKHVVRMLKFAKNPDDFLAKKRRKEKDGQAKRPLKRPLLTVAKKDGEYTVTMETMKTYAKQRTYNQHPYEDKPAVVYTIGRTPEENLQRKKKKERARRRLERLQRDFVQSAFTDMCQEICLKSYQQALQLLPGAEDPDCSCHPAEPGPDKINLDHSCSCSEDENLSESDTDSDEWHVEFTPPNATFRPKFKPKRIVHVDNATQYSYLDYRVKLLDRAGNPVPRFFKGPDGKEQCSDLGGFWDPDHNWLEINIDGFIGPDEKWVPNTFLGPDGEVVDGESGKFQTMNGDLLVIGVNGYVDNGKWKFYNKPQKPNAIKKVIWRKSLRNNKEGKPTIATWNCFGTTTCPKLLSKMGIVGHGYDKKRLQATLTDMVAQGEDVKIPELAAVPRFNKPRKKLDPSRRQNLYDNRKCIHSPPSDKGIVAIDGHGNKIYFRLKDYNNNRPKDRIKKLSDQGISVSSFHMPCMHSFISSEVMKKEQYDRLVALAERRGQTGGRQERGRRRAPKHSHDNHSHYHQNHYNEFSNNHNN